MIAADARAGAALQRFQDTLHDIKTPVSLLCYLAQDLETDAALPDNARRVAAKMREYSLRVADMLLEMNETDKLLDDRFSPTLARHDLVALAENMAQSVVALAARKSVSVIFDTDTEELPARVDKHLFERMLLNLLSNAVKFSLPGGDVRMNLTHNRAAVAIAVADQGVGFTEDELANPFNRRRPGHPELNENGGGIGLAITHEMAVALGGTLEAMRGDGGRGAKLRLTLPIGDEQISLEA